MGGRRVGEKEKKQKRNTRSMREAHQEEVYNGWLDIMMIEWSASANGGWQNGSVLNCGQYGW